MTVHSIAVNLRAMVARTTSRDAYIHLVETGQLLGKQRRIVDKLINMGPSTSGEVLKQLRIPNVNAWRGRFTELNARGLIREIGARKCKISGRVCLVWEAAERTAALDRKRGHSLKNGAAAWRDMAAKLAELLERAVAGDVDDTRTTLADYRKLAQQRRV